ncbi:MAG: hypothetical protein NT062_34075 [Proteobacteria bacterium]|nr:hypothetical protein [Pseudomonadota bacterium]
MRRLVFVLVLSLGAIAPVAAEPPDSHEILDQRPSGFWTSNRPAVGGAYRYRLLVLGVGVAALTGLLMWRLLRKTDAQRTR